MDELEKLYNILSRDGYYTKSFDDFKSQYQDEKYRDKVYDVVSRDGLYTKSKEDFLNKYTVDVLDVDVKEKPTTVTRPISVMTEKTREIDPSKVESSLFDDNFKLLIGEDKINKVVERQDKKIDRIVNDLIGDDVEENVKIKYKTDIKNLPIETINTLADLSAPEETTTYDLSEVITYPQINFPTQSAAAAAISPSFQGGDQYSQMLDYQKQIDQLQTEPLPKPAEVEKVEDASKPMQKHTKITTLLNNINDQLDDLSQVDPIGNEDKINELKSQRTSLENIQKITNESINSFANITKTILEEDMSSDEATAITDLLINTDATLYEGLPIRPEANQYLLNTKLPSNLTEYNKFLEWNESLGMLNASGSQINEMANKLNIPYEDMLKWVEEYSALMRNKMNAEDVHDLRLEDNAVWLGELGMIATDLNMSKFPKDAFELSELNKVKEQQYNIFVGMNDALELENVPMIVDNLYQNGFFDGEMFLEKTEEEIAPLINDAFNRLGINAYAGVSGTDRSITDIAASVALGTAVDLDRLGNNITISSKNGPDLILNTNQSYKTNAANVALELYEYIKKYGEFQSTQSLKNLKTNRQTSDFGIQMRNEKFIEYQAAKLNGEADMLIKENNKLNDEFNEISTQLTNEYKEAEKQLQDFIINQAEVVDGTVDPNVIKAKQAELFNPIIQKQEEYQEYFKIKREAASLSQDDLKLQKTNYDNAVQASFIMESRKGTFESATVNSILTGTERLVLGGAKLANDLITYINPLQYASAWLQGKDASDEIDKYLKDFNKSYIEANRGFLTDLGPKPLEQYLQASHEDLLYGSWLGLMESAPAMLLSAATGGGAAGVATFSLQQIDYLNEEMNKIPYFDNISEAEKWTFIAPLAIATGVLEEVGFAKGVLNKGSSNVLNTLTFNVLKKLPENATLSSFKELMNLELKNSIAKGLIRITKGGALEYETGALQALTEVGLKEFYEWSKQDGKVHEQIFKTAADEGAIAFFNEIQNQALSEMLGGFYASTPMAIASGMSENRLGRTSTDNQFKFLEFVTKGKANMDLIETGLKQELASGKITQQQYNELVQKVKVSGSIFREIPKNADLQDRKLAYDLVTEKRKLQDEINIAKDQQNGASVESQIARVKEIDEQLKQISTYASNKGKKQRVNTPVLNNAKNTNLLSTDEIQLINNIQELYASDKYVGTIGEDVRDLDVMENAITELETISNNLKESGSNVKENIANDIDKLINFISNKASGTQNYISVDLNKEIKNGKVQQDIEDLYAAYRSVDGYLGQTVYFVNNKPISAREFENLMQDKEFIEQLQNGESNYLILGPSINDVNNYTGEEFLTKDITETRRTKVAEDLEKAEGLAEEIAPTVPLQSLETSKDFVEAVTEAGYNLSEDDAKNIDALITDEGEIFINKEVAKRTGAVSAPLHEVLHKIIDSEIKDPARKVEIIQEFKDELIKNPAAYDAVEKRLLEAYGETMTPEQLENSDEWVTAFFDGVARGQIKYNENVFTKIGDWVVNNILRPLGFSKIKFNSGRDVFNFAKSFGKEFKTGKVKKATKEFAKKTTAKPTQKTETKVQPELELAFSKTASDKVQQIYEEQGPAGAVEIIEQFKPITNKLVQRRSEAPNFDRELLTSEIELGERGLLDLINSYNPESGVPLAAYINKYLPSRAIEASKRVLGEQFTGDVTEARGIVQPAAEEIITEQAEVTEAKPKVKTTRQKLGIKTGSELYNKVKDAVAKTFGTKLPDPDSPNFRKELNKAYRTELKKPIADLLGTRNAYREFLETNWETLYNAIPQSILNKRFKQFIQPVVDETGKQRREKTAVGKGIFQRRDITKQEFVNYFLSPDVGASTRGTRKDALAEAIGEELALDATMEVIQDPKVLEKYEQIRELEGKPTTKQTIPKISEKVERPRGFKFSIQKNIREGVRKEGAEPITVGKKSVDRLVEIFLNDALDTFSNFLFQDITKKGKFQFISSSVLSNAGNTLERARKAGFPFIGSYEKGLADTKKRLMKDNPNMSEKKAEAQALQIMKPTRDALNAGELFETENLKKLVKESLKDKTKKFTSEELKLLNLAIDGQTRVKLEKNIKNIEDINKGKDLLLDLLRELYQKNPKNLDFISFISYHHKSNTNPFRNFATVIGEESGNLNRPYEEHTLPFGEFATTMLKAITKSDKTFKGFKDWIKDNYFQEVIEYGTTRAILDQPTRSLAKDNETKLPSWKSKSELHPLLKQHIQEALDGKREWKDVVSPDIRKYNEYSSILGYINPNKVSRLGITDAQRYNVEVAKDLQNNPDMIAAQNRLIYQQLIGEITNTKEISQALKAEEALAKGKYKASRSNIKSLDGSGVVKMSKSLPNSEILREAGIMDKALNIARDPNAPVKKIRVFDFDDTLARTKSNVLYTMPDGKEGKLTAEEFAKRGTEMLEQGAEFDFSEFNKVMKGRKGPLFEVAKKIQDARGTEDVFVLTARAAEAAPAIKEFLDSVGLNIPLKNITGLGDSSPLAKSGWIVGKAAEGYNDFYFADDAIKNVNAVKKVLDVIDVKSKVQQAKIKFSKNVDKDFNKIIEQKTGVDWYKEYSSARAQTMGAGKGKFKFLIPPSAEDFTGLLYRFLGKGKVGDAQMAWFKEHLLNPYARGMNDLSTDRVTMMNDFNALKKELAKSGSIPKNLKKKAIDNFTYEDVARVMAWDQQGIEVADLSKRDMEEFRSFIEKDPGLQVFVDQLIAINKGDGYTYPGKNWLAGNITTDLVEGLNTNKRDKYLEQWRENVDIIFSEKNLNKIEALFGSRYREALEDSLRRMKSGKNRTSTGNRLENRLLDYVNNSVGTVMFLNMRSGVLQTISSINFLNWKDNNPLRAGIAFANQKQYWKDFMTLMNSDFLVDRRKGLKINVAESEIFEAARNEKNKARAVVNYLLKKGFTVTQIMDSFAIASGGATFYRNRIKSLMKGGMTREEAETQAFQDFRETAEESQQSARPDKISQQQASGLGRVVLAFANTPMQYNRIIKKATLDLINGRGDYKTNLSKIVYYGMIQNIIFTALQQAIFAMAFSDEEDEEEKKKYYKVGNSMLDNLLRGLGVGGQAVLTVKNIGMDVYDKYQKSIAPDASFFDKQPDYAESAWHLLDFSPPISIKARKLRQAATTWEYNNWKHYKDPWSLDDPAWLASGYVISAFTNIPLDRLVKKIDNVRGAMESDQEWWKRVAMLSGWAEWELESTADKETRKQEEKIERRIFEGKQDPSNWTEAEQKDILRQYNVSENALKRLNTKEKRAELIKKLQKKTNKTYTPSAVMLTPEYIELSKLNKDEQVKILKDLNVSPAVISRMKNEDKRIKSIITIRKKRNESK